MPSTWRDLKSQPQDHEASAQPLCNSPCQPFQTCYERPLNKQTPRITNFCSFSEKATFWSQKEKWKKKRKETQKEVSTKTDVDENFDENKKSQNFESKNNFSLERKKILRRPFDVD